MNTQFKVTNEMISAASTVFMAMAYTQTVREVVVKIEQDILNKYQYKWDTEKAFGTPEQIKKYNRQKRDIIEFTDKYGEYCKSESMTYLISDKDFGHYLTEKHAAVTKSGFKVEFGYCPLLTAESNERDAKRLLIEIMEPITEMSFDRILTSVEGVKNLAKMVDLSLRLLVPYVKKNKAA